MTQSETHNTHPSVQDVAVIVGGGPGISASCARLFAQNGLRVGIAARNPDKPVLQNLDGTHGVRRYACDASEPAAVAMLFQNIVRDLGAPTLVVHNIDGWVPGIFDKEITQAEPSSDTSVDQARHWGIYVDRLERPTHFARPVLASLLLRSRNFYRF